MPSIDPDVADANYVSLTTFRRPVGGASTGVPVSTPVWVVRDGDRLLVTTDATAGKVKRLRHTPAVSLQACSMRGTPKPGAPIVTGTAEILTDPEARRRLSTGLAAKYGILYRLFMGSARRRERAERTTVVLSIRLDD
ncbi:PPOX class F420-dependent oxidoreductase [Lacisediminihabitans sp.]|uniref:PPOX class F420-dependent oxidoreductase n=1 Tax=Lacisediminihabitans sp. TaxID=2787631 RepID=UPI00374D0154